MGNTTSLSMAASPWAPTGLRELFVREQSGVAPIASQHGTGVVAARFLGGYALKATRTHAAPTLAAVRKDDARVPDPRRQQR